MRVVYSGIPPKELVSGLAQTPHGIEVFVLIINL
jgi:hypothetical protein